MDNERGEESMARDPKGAKPSGFFGTLKDALMAAGRDEVAEQPAPAVPQKSNAAVTPIAVTPSHARAEASAVPPPRLSAEDAARLARTTPIAAPDQPLANASTNATDRAAADAPPTTRVVRRDAKDEAPAPARTVLVRGRQSIERHTFERDPVVGFLVIVGGPGLGSHRAIYEGNNTIGRSAGNRIALDFGDDTISADAQAYVRYDSNDRSFLFVPNLAKTNVVSVNNKRPTAAVELKAMDVITLGRTQVAFVPFCGADFDWSDLSET